MKSKPRLRSQILAMLGALGLVCIGRAEDAAVPLIDHLPVVVAVKGLPLPIIGSVYPVSRQAGLTDQDMSGSKNETMREHFYEALKDNRPLLFAGGHEHTMEVLDGDIGARYRIVSGAGIYGHTKPIKFRDQTLFARSQGGFMRLDFSRDGRVRLAVIAVDETGGYEEAFSIDLE